MNFPLFISRRLYSHGADTRQVSRQAITITTVGIALGLAVMIVTLCVVLGFKRAVRDKLVNFGSHVQIQAFQTYYGAEVMPIQISDSLQRSVQALPGVMSVSRYCLKNGVLKTDEAFMGVAFRGVEKGKFNGDSLEVGKEGLIVSKRMAEQLKLSEGSRIYAYFFDGKLRMRRFTVERIYESGLSEFDKNVAFCNYAMLHQLAGLAPDQASGAEVVLSDFDSIAAVSACLVRDLNRRTDDYGAQYTTPTIMELYPNIFSWLELLDLNVLVILILMMLVAGFSVISGLLIIILERTQFIGLMKALGSTNGTLRRVFMLYAVQLSLRGMLLGDALGLGICFLQQRFHLFHLDASTYYVDAVPITFNWLYLGLLNVAVAALILLALLLPTLLVSHIHPARSMRFE